VKRHSYARENSGILELLKVGDLLNVKYYSRKSAYASKWQKTAVVTSQGRIKEG